MGRAFLCPPGSPLLAAMSLYSPAASSRLCAVLRPAGGIFAPMSGRAEHVPKRKTAVKAIHRPVTAFYTIVAIPIFPHRKTAHSGRQRPAHGIKQPRPTPSGASRGIIICCGQWIAPRSALCQRPTRRSEDHGRTRNFQSA